MTFLRGPKDVLKTSVSAGKGFKEIWNDVSLRLILKDKDGKKHCLPFVGSNLGVEIFFEKEGTSEKECVKIEDWGTSVLFALWFQENSMQSLSAFLLFFTNKKNSESSVYFHSLIIEFLWLSNYGSNSGKRYTLRLLSMCLGRSTFLYSG